MPGQAIYWRRGAGAHHADCETARLTASMCTSCKGAGALWNNAPCRVCDGTGARAIQELAAKPVAPDRFDMDYEDACARACGL